MGNLAAALKAMPFQDRASLVCDVLGGDDPHRVDQLVDALCLMEEGFGTTLDALGEARRRRDRELVAAVLRLRLP